MRLFIAILLAAQVADELSALTARLRSPGDGLRWTAPETWHITLQFLGSASEQQCACMSAHLLGVQSAPVPIGLEELGFFERAGVFFAGVRLTPELVLAQQRVVAASSLCGFAAESRPFQPHITLARSKGGGQRRNLGQLRTKMRAQPKFSPFVAAEFLLYESFLGGTGARYEVRGRFPLSA